jgi:hypothetical protein
MGVDGGGAWWQIGRHDIGCRGKQRASEEGDDVEEKWERISPYVVLTRDKYVLRRFVKAVLLDR